MKRLKLIAAAITVLLTFEALPALAQQTSEPMPVFNANSSASTALLLSGADQVNVPEGAGAWTVQILTSGGISGTGKNDLFLTSAGDFARQQNSSNESKPFLAVVLQPLTELVSKLKIAELNCSIEQPMRQTSNVSVCSDCYKTTFILSRREPDARIKTFVAKWDLTTRAQVADEVLQVYQQVINLLAVNEQTAK